ncbi:hypothetical protein AVEN_54606-1 [Araneus ventricosus]|uniref:Uncharacterized protein n=1 Tax=Araneus ventricosus TaxID=182803 RepID=A0A4Y2BNV8_ARAVE|nr:hypothetical protein AVEN_54606-1 [Araneus ventricosus]
MGAFQQNGKDPSSLCGLIKPVQTSEKRFCSPWVTKYKQVCYPLEETISGEFQDYFIIATDASKSQFYTSIAGISNLRSFSFRIHTINSIFTAEALAIC